MIGAPGFTLATDILPVADKCAKERVSANRCSDVTLTRFAPALSYSLVIIGDAVQVGPLHRGPSLIQRTGSIHICRRCMLASHA